MKRTTRQNRKLIRAGLGTAGILTIAGLTVTNFFARQDLCADVTPATPYEEKAEVTELQTPIKKAQIKPLEHMLEDREDYANYANASNLTNWNETVIKGEDGIERIVYDNPATPNVTEIYGADFAKGSTAVNQTLAYMILAFDMAEHIEGYKNLENWSENEDGTVTNPVFRKMDISISKKERNLLLQTAEQVRENLEIGSNDWKMRKAHMLEAYEQVLPALEDERTNFQRVLGTNHFDNSYEFGENRIKDSITAAKSGYAISRDNYGVHVVKDHPFFETPLAALGAYIATPGMWAEEKTQDIPLVEIVGDFLKGTTELIGFAPYDVSNGIGDIIKGDEIQSYTQAREHLANIPRNENGDLLALNGSDGRVEGTIDAISGAVRLHTMYKILNGGSSSSNGGSSTNPSNPTPGPYIPGGPITY